MTLRRGSAKIGGMKKSESSTQTKENQQITANVWIPWLLIAIFALGLLTSVILATVGPTRGFQRLNYDEYTDGILLNPDQGFYRTARLKINSDGTFTKSLSANSDTQVFHLRADISDLSGVVNGAGDVEIPQAGLIGLDEALAFYKTRGKNVIIRFCYDPKFGGAANKEAEVSMILRHIEQIGEVLNKYQTTLTAIEAGMVGPWGEMHTSEKATAAVINQIINAWLANTDNMPILVRTPKQIYNYIGITVDDVETATIPQEAYRLGIFNDGYLGSGNDLGTYTKRELEVEFLSKQTAHLPYGGEVTVPDSTWHDIDKCLPEMFKMNLSYLNYEWNTYVVQTKWKQSTYTIKCGNDRLWYGRSAFEYIANHLGYRLVLRQSVLRYNKASDELTIQLKVDNVGFGEFYRTKNLTLYLVNSEGNVYSANVGSYNGGSISLKIADVKTTFCISTGEYTVYLGINTLENGETSYPVRFANDLWNAELGANNVGAIKIK